MFADGVLIKYEKDEDNKVGATKRSDEQIEVCMRDKLMGVALIKRSKHDHKKLIKTIRDQHAFGLDVYPKTLNDAYELLENHSSTDKERRDEDNKTRKEKETARRSRGRGSGGNEGGKRGGEHTREGFSLYRTVRLFPELMAESWLGLSVLSVRSWDILQICAHLPRKE